MFKWLVVTSALCISFMASAQCLFDSVSRRPDAFYVNMGGRDSVAVWKAEGHGSDRPEGNRSEAADIGKFTASLYGVECEMSLRDSTGCRIMEIRLTNRSPLPFQPVKAGIKLGIDTYMESYPEWLDKHFPTLLMCEKTHFWGYFQSPSGHLLGLASPDPVASWSLDYNLGYPEPEPYWFWGHRIEAVNIDLLNALPLPENHPQHLWELKPGESQNWKFYGVLQDNTDRCRPQDRKAADQGFATLEEKLSRIAGIPLISTDRTSYSPGDTARWEAVIDGKGHIHETVLEDPGTYPISVSAKGKTATGLLSVHPSWEWTLRTARENVLTEHQKATSHVESWYGFHTGFLAAKYFPEPELDSRINERFDYIMDLLYGQDRTEPKYYAWRLQNTSSTAGMFIDRYEAYGDVEDLKTAGRLADWLIEYSQAGNGAYMNGKTVYTSVIYVAKSILEVAAAEKSRAEAIGSGSADVGRDCPGRDTMKNEILGWKEAARRHFSSAKRAIDQLVAAQGDFHTEGELTFEDGMVSCSALQIGQLAVMLGDFTGTDDDGFVWNIASADEADSLRRVYTEELLSLLGSHDCLTQLRVPDARRRGGTLRFWEAQYDVNMMPNMLSSPHGWSAWRAYATWYAWLLTGEERWLLETLDAAGAFSLLIDQASGKLRWAFVVDPYVRAKQMDRPVPGSDFDAVSLGNAHPDMYGFRSLTVGAEYLPMVSSWQPNNTCDNDVHEVFKFIAEAVLTNAFVVFREDGSIGAYNCSVETKGKKVMVRPDERQIGTVYVSGDCTGRKIMAEGRIVNLYRP